MSAIPLGCHAYLWTKSSSQRTAAITAVKNMLDKGGNDIVFREDLRWSDIQTTEGGSYDWTIPDAIVTAVADAGGRMWWILNKPPAWATAAGGSINQSWRCPPYPEIKTAGNNFALTAFVAFASAAAARYGPTGTFWQTYSGTARPSAYFEVLNEEYTSLNSNKYVGGQFVEQYPSPHKYAYIYDVCAAAIHAAGAKAAASVARKIWHADPIGWNYLDVFLNNVTERLDCVSIHMYTNVYQPASYVHNDPKYTWQYWAAVQQTYDQINASGFDNVRFWITEVGWPSIPGTVSEATQASRFSDLWTVVENQDFVEGLILFCLSNPDHPDNPDLSGYDATHQENYYALYHTGADRNDLGSAKPAVATITGLPGISRDDVRKHYFVKPDVLGDLPTNIKVKYESLPALSRGTPINVLEHQPLSSNVSYSYAGVANTFSLVNAEPTTAPYDAGKVTIPWSDTNRFLISGNLTDQSGYGVNQMNGASYDTVNSKTSYEVEFWHSGTDLAIRMYSYGSSDMQMWVDGVRFLGDTAGYGWYPLPPDAGIYWLRIKFSTWQARKIRIIFGFQAFGGILIPSTNTAINAPSPGSRINVAITGDSYVTGSASTSEGAVNAGAFAGELAVRTGWKIWNLAQGSTGYVNPGNGLTTSPGPNGIDYFGSDSRIGALSYLPPLDAVIVWGGCNDANTYPNNTTVMRAFNMWSAIAEQRPGTPIIVGGPQSGVFKNISAQLDSLNADLKAAAAAHPAVVAYIDQRNPMWVDGTGKLGASTGDGNADIFVASDGIHPTHAGFGYQADLAIKALNNVRLNRA